MTPTGLLAITRSNFFGPIVRQSPSQALDMLRLYRWCRAIDHSIDDAPPDADRRAILDKWYADLGHMLAGSRPKHRASRGLMRVMKRTILPTHAFKALFEGFAMDAAQAPITTYETLERYADGVAGAVGELSLPIMQVPPSAAATRYAICLGRALQFTNILRDVAEDAEAGRNYLPLEWLADHGEQLTKQALANRARDYYAEADSLLTQLDQKKLRPAIGMAECYKLILDGLA